MRNFVINNRCVFFLLIFSILIAFGVWTIDEVISIPIIILGGFLFLGYSIAFPICCVINSQGVTVYYLFGFVRKRIAWNELKYVEDHHSKSGVLPWWREYQIAYFKTKFPLWEKACIPKTKKVVKLFETYYGGTIEKYG